MKIDFEKWKRLKQQKGLSYDDIANTTGSSRDEVIELFRGGISDPDIEKVQAIESALNQPARLSIDITRETKKIASNAEIIGAIDLDDLNPIPLLGRVVAGKPIEEQEHVEGYIYVNYRPKEEYFALRVFGESMIGAGIRDNSILVVHKQAWADSGEIVVAVINGEQTVKRLKCYGKNKIFLMPENPDFEPIPVTEKDNLIILGKVVEVRITF